jgi:hypothetical protein
MRAYGRFFWMGSGLVLGIVASGLLFRAGPMARASTSDRFEDYVMCTGAVGITPRAPTDGLWMLDYRKGKLKGTVIDRSIGKIIGWAELDLVQEFGLQPRQDVHFMMTTGNIAQGQAALYVAEVNSGKIGVYTLQQAVAGNVPFGIYRHDLNGFRENFAIGLQNTVAVPRRIVDGDGSHKPSMVPFAGPGKSAP